MEIFVIIACVLLCLIYFFGGKNVVNFLKLIEALIAVGVWLMVLYLISKI